jgi:hypothetical protein
MTKTTTAPSVKFERFERDCPANKTMRQNHKDSNRPRLIYDFKVMIDGEHRATWQRVSFSTGYNLFDPDHRPIQQTSASEYSRRSAPHADFAATIAKLVAVHVASQADFAATIAKLMTEDRIPTLDQLEALRAKEAATEAEKKRQQAELDAYERKEKFGPQLYEMLKRLIRPYETLTEEALIDGILMEYGPPKPERGRLIVAARKLLADVENVPFVKKGES